MRFLGPTPLAFFNLPRKELQPHSVIPSVF